MEKAVEEIRCNGGTQFDPRLVAAFERLYQNGLAAHLDLPAESVSESAAQLNGAAPHAATSSELSQ